MKRIFLAVLAAGWINGAIGEAADTVTLHVQKAPTASVLRGIAEIGGIDIAVDDEVKGTVTADLTDIPAEEALQLVAEMKGLHHRVRNGVHLFGGEIKKELQVYPLEYARPEEVAEALSIGALGEQIQAYSAGQAVIAYADSHEHAAIQRLLAEMDKKPPQVKLEVQVVAVNRENIKELGIDWDWQPLTGSASYERETWSVQKPVIDSKGDTVYDDDGIPRTKTHEYTDWKITGPEGYGSIQFGRSVSGHPYSFFFQAKLNALEAAGKASVLARPHVMALNGKEAHILIGDKVPVLTEHLVNGETQRTTEYMDAGIKLIYTPHISKDGYITAQIHAEVSTPLLVPEMKAYHIVTRQADTEVRMTGGEPLIIGGLIDKTEMEQFRKIPLLGDLPILGKLFQSRHTAVKETEVLIFLKASSEETKPDILPGPAALAYYKQEMKKNEQQREEST